MEETVEQVQAKLEPVKISALELENVKRIRAVALRPTENGLTVIGGSHGRSAASASSRPSLTARAARRPRNCTWS